ncbi:BolA family transcriptional regulator [Phanerochaete sordida]|uniref:BolA family transcriptional regulator n=1 Tax=Phanerochaete sordida TaxID=48140 RepID=A0A9P3LF43_9APHY|nr:BolA family transcriptional regulator [Phanerochaete sordida]
MLVSARIALRSYRLTPRLLPAPLFRAQHMSSTQQGSVELSIREKLTTVLAPAELKITNDSWQHRHHAAMKAQGGGSGETHFSIDVVSEAFKGKTTMQRHRMIYAALTDEFAQGLHALSLKTKTVEEHQKTNSA